MRTESIKGSSLCWPACAKVGVPRWVGRALRLPQQGIERVAFALALRVATSLGKNLNHLVTSEMGDSSQGICSCDVVVQVTIQAVYSASSLQILDSVDN